MTKKQTVKVEVEINVSDLCDMVKDAGYKIPANVLKAKLQSPEFKKSLAEDLVNVWIDTNNDSDMCDVVIGLLGDEFIEKYPNEMNE